MQYIILDTETASLTQGVVELAFVEIDSDLNVLNQFCSYVNPERAIDPGAQAIHGITAEMVEWSPNLAKVAEYIPKDAHVAGHNISFDCRMIRPSYVPAATLCTLSLARQHLKTVTNHKLVTLQKELNLPQRNAHSALDDVFTTLDLLRHLLPRTGRTLQELFSAAKLPKVIHKMPIGKFKGTPMLEVPKSYRDWMLKEGSFDKDIMYSLNLIKDVL